MFNLFLFLICSIFPLPKKNFPQNIPTQAHVHQIDCSTEFQEVFSCLQKLPKVHKLIREILEEGPIHIKKNQSFPKTFEGYWSSENRTIYLTKAKATSKEVLISTLLFELHNAARDTDLKKLDHLAYRREIDKKKYIKSIEFIEYQNVLATAALLDEGIVKKIFSPSCRWHTPCSFEKHFSIQQKMGHSAWIGKIYDSIVQQA